MNEELIKAVKSLLSDIEEMGNPINYWFGPFSEFEETDGGNVEVEWPNLAISAAKVKELLDGPAVDGSLAAPQLTGNRCSVCNKPQFDTPHGITCENGHGGADPADELVAKGLAPAFKVGDYVTGYAEAYGHMSGEIVEIDLSCPDQWYKIKSASGWPVWLVSHTVELAARPEDAP